jgi:hypothetical protein
MTAMIFPKNPQLDPPNRPGGCIGRHPLVRWSGAVLIFFLTALTVSAQVSAGSADPATRLPRVFIAGSGIERKALRTGIPFIDLVEDPAQAQVRVSIESGPDGSIVRFLGQAEFQNKNDELTCRREAGEPAEAFQNKVIQTIKLGLMRYVSKTPAAGRINVRLLDLVKPTSVVDPWNFWVFSAGVDAFLNGEESYKSEMWMGNFSASRVTPQWKIRLGLNGNYQVNAYSLEDFQYRSTSNSKSFNGLFVRSLGEHWSAGAQVQIVASTFNNTRWSLIPRPAVEFDLFPYSESTKKQFRFLYSIGPTFVRYMEETIYDRTRETLLSESLTASLELKQPWGSISTSLAGSHYIGHADKYRVELNAGLSIRLFQGMSFNIQGSGSRIHDQLALPKGGASYEEIVLQRKQLATSFQYYFSVGFSYSFGSIFSNVINPRFGSGNGGMSMSISM